MRREPRPRAASLRRVLRAAVPVAALLAAAGCQAGPWPDGTPRPGTVRVVATTTVLADMVRQVGGERAGAESLVPRGGEVHTFDPTPPDAARLSDADLVVMNGLGLDDWLGRLAGDVGTKAPIVRLGEDLPGVEYLRDRDAGPVNPHVWLDVTNAIAYARRLGEALAAVDPAGAGAYARATDAYVARLAELDRWALDRLSAIPAAQRRIVSFHDALPYFARRYGLEVVGVVVAVPGQDPSAGEVADLIDAIRAVGARAIISEVQFSADLARTIAEETGATVVSDLYTDTLGDPPVDTYEGLIRWDVERIAGALQ